MWILLPKNLNSPPPPSANCKVWTTNSYSEMVQFSCKTINPPRWLSISKLGRLLPTLFSHTVPLKIKLNVKKQGSCNIPWVQVLNKNWRMLWKLNNFVTVYIGNINSNPGTAHLLSENYKLDPCQAHTETFFEDIIMTQVRLYSSLPETHWSLYSY